VFLDGEGVGPHPCEGLAWEALYGQVDGAGPGGVAMALVLAAGAPMGHVG
jgi:hypothetical protein